MVASNFPVDRLTGSFRDVFQTLRIITAELTETERRQLFHDNAVRLYRL